jgi:hypothetical protein
MSNQIAYETEAKLLHGENFVDKVKDISKKLGINPSWLMECMQGESGLNPKAVNWKSDTDKKTMFAVGLIQFIPSTLQGWNLTPQEVYSMDAFKQLNLVYRYYNAFRSLLPKVKSYENLHLLTFVPDGVGKDDNFTILSKYENELTTVGQAKNDFRYNSKKNYLSLAVNIAKKHKVPTMLIIGTLLLLIYNYKKIKL